MQMVMTIASDDDVSQVIISISLIWIKKLIFFQVHEKSAARRPRSCFLHLAPSEACRFAPRQATAANTIIQAPVAGVWMPKPVIGKGLANFH